MGFTDPAFKHIKLGQPHFEIWRVENFEVKPLPNSRYGSFYEGDSYIIYYAAPSPGKFSTKVSFDWPKAFKLSSCILITAIDMDKK